MGRPRARGRIVEAGVALTAAATAFYCVSDSRYFLGAVGLINSLRLQGHAEPIHLLDCGLTAEQRALIDDEVVLVDAPDDTPPYLLKTIAPLAHPAEVMVLIDVDMIATRNLGELIETARQGRVVAFRDRQQRFFEAWGTLGLGSAEPGPYVSSGLVLAGGQEGMRMLQLLADKQDCVDFSRTFWRANERGYPYLYADQDVLNAVLRTSLPHALVDLDQRLAATPPYRDLRLVDPAALHCAFRDGVRPYVLHQFVRKPWLEPMYHGIYSRLLARLLLGEGIAIEVGSDAVPRRMRSGASAWLDRSFVNAHDLGRYYFGDRLPAWIGARIESRRQRRRQGANA